MTGNHTTAGLPRRDFLRVLGAGATALAAAPALGACARAPEPSGGGDGGTFTLYTSAGHVYPAYQKVVKEFEKAHGLKVNWQKYQWPDLQPKLLADLASGNVPDLVAQPGGSSAIPLAMTGDVLALDEHVAKDGEKIGYPDDWHDQAVDSWKHDGKVYGVQLHLTCNQLYYNKGMLADAGFDQPPSDWDELLDVARTLTKGKRYGLALNQDYSYGSCWLVQNGVRYYDAKTKSVLQPRKAAIDAMRFQRDLVHRYKVSPAPIPSADPAGPQKLLIAERAGMIFSGPWDIAPIKQGNPDLELAVAPPLKGQELSTYFAGMGVFIPKKSKKADLAWDLITRLTKLDVELEVTKFAQMSMPRKTWAEHPDVKADPLIAGMAKALPLAKDWQRELAPTGKGPEVNAEFKTFYQSVVIKDADPAKAVEDFAAAADRALS